MKNFVGEWGPGGAHAAASPSSPPDRGHTPPTATKIDEARKQIRYAREAHELPHAVDRAKGQVWRDVAFRQHRCLAELRACEQELAHLQDAVSSQGPSEDLASTMAKKQQEVDQASSKVIEAEEDLENVDAEYQGSEGETCTLNADLQSVTMQPKGFVWFLKVAAAMAPTPEEAPANADLEQRGSSRPSKDNSSFMPAGAASGTLEELLGIRIPDTVFLKKGKPTRRYSLDAEGRVQVTRMKTSAELLRVLRDFVRKAIRPRMPAVVRVAEAFDCLSKGSLPAHKLSAAPGMGGNGTMQAKMGSRSRSDGALKGRAAKSSSSISDLLGPGMAGGANPLTEVAVLHYCADEDEQPSLFHSTHLSLSNVRYDDSARRGAVRLMTYVEALAQLKGASKLPRAFWQNIRVLQTPIQSAAAGVTTRYITYSYDAALAGEIDPQEPVPLGGFQAGSEGPQSREEAARVAAVPRKVNEYLLRCKKGQFYLSLVSGQFEFVLDEADGTLWLVNASRLVIERRQEPKQKDPKVAEVKYFEEEEFTQLLREEDLRLTQNIKRFVNTDPATPKSPDGMPTFTLNAADRLRGVRVPEELMTFYAAEHEMVRYYKEEVVRMMERAEGVSTDSGRSVSLPAFFRFWARACGLRGRRKHRRNGIDRQEF